MRFSWKDAVEEGKRYLPQYLDSTGRSTRKDFTCINPEHTDKHPSMKYDRQRNKAHCFSCKADYDIYDVVSIDTGLKGRDLFLKVFSMYGIEVEEDMHTHKDTRIDTYTHTHTYNDAGKEEEPKEVDYTDFFEQANRDLEKTNYHRGISLDTLNRYKVGFVENWKNPKAPKMKPSPRLIIPTSKYSYLARYAGEGNYINYMGKEENKSKVGSVHIFNIDALKSTDRPIFIVEGEIDALSIIDLGGVAIGMGSMGFSRQLKEGLAEIQKEKPIKNPFIIALDSERDEEKKARVEQCVKDVEAVLDELGLHHYRVDLTQQYKDANEALQADREVFECYISIIEGDIAKAELEAGNAEREEYYRDSAYNHLQEFINGIAESVNTPAQPTGFPKLDSILEGGLYEGLYVLGAISSLGKTTLVLQIADQIAESGQDVLIFSLEMARSELMSKSISRQTILDVLNNNGNMRDAKTNRGITVGARYANYSQTEKDLIKRSITSYGEYAKHIFIHEGIGNIGTDYVREQVERHKRLTGKAPVVFIDYLQILAPYDIRATDKQNTDKAVLELKRISRDYKTPVFGISSFNRENYKKKVTMEAFKESGAIEYSSDVLMGLQLAGVGKDGFSVNDALKNDPREIELVILKNRNGSTGDTITYKYYKLFNYFKED